MKTKKKLLLMGVGAMSALAIGVGATSTFAWYTATVKSAVDTVTNNVTVGSQHVELETASLDFAILDVSVAATDLASGHKLGLAHYVDNSSDATHSTAENLGTGYYDNGKFYKIPVSQLTSKNIDLSQEVVATITISSSKLTAEATRTGLSTSEILGQLFTSDAKMKVTFTTPTNAVDATYYEAGDAEVLAATKNVGDEKTPAVANRARLLDGTTNKALSTDPIDTAPATLNLAVKDLITQSGSLGSYTYSIKSANKTGSARFYIYGGEVGAGDATTANDGTTDVSGQAKIIATVEKYTA